jgi:hypothetical protein
MTTLPPDHLRHIDLTARLVSLKSSLTPHCKLFEPSPPLFVSRRSSDEPARWFLRLFVAFLVIDAAILAAYFIAFTK